MVAAVLDLDIGFNNINLVQKIIKEKLYQSKKGYLAYRYLVYYRSEPNTYIFRFHMAIWFLREF